MIANNPNWRVSLLIERTAGASSRMLEGIGSWMRTHRGWVVQRRDSFRPDWDRVAAFHPQGIIAEVGDEEMAQRLATFGCPVVNIANMTTATRLPRVCTDDRAVGRLQAEHLLRLGHRNLAYFGNLAGNAGQERCEGFRAAAHEAGADIRVFDVSREVLPQPYGQWTSIVGDWLLGQRLPIAIATASAQDATNVAQRCMRRNIKIPEQLVIVCVDDDIASMEICDPPASAVLLPYEQIGFRAAALLQALLDNPASPAAGPVCLPPLGLKSRRSSEMVAVDDPALAKAVRFIRDHASKALGVEEVASHCGLSRRVLEKRFAGKLRTTPFAEIRFHQLEYVRQLLMETDYTIEEIANRSAFAHTAHLIEAFRKTEKCTPGQYRRRVRRA